MPAATGNPRVASSGVGGRFVLVQDRQPAAAETGTTEKHNPGEIPSPGLLFANSVLVAILMVIFALIARRRLEQIPTGMQNLVERIAEYIDDFTGEILGPAGKKYSSLVGTVFFYILLMNLIGAIPGFHSPTTNLTITLALGVCVFVYVQFQGIKANGLWGYISHFAGPKWSIISILLFPIELISEFVKPFTLAIRLFGNIFGEDVIIAVLAGLGAASVLTKWIPFHFPVLFLSILTDVVQATVFAILTCIYISLLTAHHDDDHGEQESHAAPAAAH